MGYTTLCNVILLMVIQQSTQFILERDNNEPGNFATGKRPAWMPQGRMGKRDNEVTNDKLNSAVTLAKKVAWVPQSRFGKRSSGFLDALRRGTMAVGSEATPDEDKRIPRMGLYAKRTNPRMGFKKVPMSQYFAENLEDEARLKLADDVDRFFSEGGQFNSEHKRAAWVPQGRFGKRSFEDILTTSDAINGILSGRVAKVTRDPNNPDVRCLSVKNNGTMSVICIRFNQESGELELLP